jgi:hypothetical protein
MTRKDVELIAATIKAARCDTPYRQDRIDALNDLTRDFADRLKATNQQFNRDKFLRACGITS